MRGLIRLSVVFLVATIVLLQGGGCSATTGYAVQIEDATRVSDTDISSVLVLGEADDYQLAYTIEQKIVENLNDRGFSAQAYSDVVADTSARSLKDNLAAVLESGVDGLIGIDVRGQGTNVELVNVYDINTGLTRQEYRVIKSITIDCVAYDLDSLEPIWMTTATVMNTAEVPWLSTHERAFSHSLVQRLVDDGVVVVSP